MTSFKVGVKTPGDQDWNSNGLPFGPYQCPTSPGEITGCGSFNTEAQLEDRTLVVECRDCGMWFQPATEFAP